MRTLRTSFADDDGHLLDYDDAARRIGVTVPTLYVKVYKWRQENGYTDMIPLSALRVDKRARCIDVIDDRVNPKATQVFALLITVLIQMAGVSRTTVFRRIGEHKREHGKEPIKLKAFLQNAHSRQGLRANQYRKLFLDDNYKG